jgi:cytochrome c oxidase subunit III
MSSNVSHTHGHDEHEASKFGMWLFIFTELLLFGGLFIVYAVYRYRNPVAFQLAGEELDVLIGTVNTIILLISSMTMAMSITAIQKNDRQKAKMFLGVTIFLALVFMVNKYFEWGDKISYGFFPDTATLHELGQGTILFFGLYFVMTGLHALHIIIGVVLLAYILFKVQNKVIHSGNYYLLENGGLYWHLVDLIWIFLFPLFYLIH